MWKVLGWNAYEHSDNNAQKNNTNRFRYTALKADECTNESENSDDQQQRNAK